MTLKTQIIGCFSKKNYLKSGDIASITAIAPDVVQSVLNELVTDELLTLADGYYSPNDLLKSANHGES